MIRMCVVLGCLLFSLSTCICFFWSGHSKPSALRSLMDSWDNEPPSWDESDPFVNTWEGITCNGTRVVSIQLSSMGLSGKLSEAIQDLAELQTLDLSYNKGLTGSLPEFAELHKLTNLILVGCSFSGPIPKSIGSLKQLYILDLSSNQLNGTIPASIGLLSNLYRLDLADNQLLGRIPVSSGSEPGLNLLVKTKHFHFGRNKLSGTIPPELFTPNMTLEHFGLLENNQLQGSIPDTLGLVSSLLVVRLDNNSLSETAPENLNNLTNVNDLYLSKNRLTGPLPDISGMKNLSYVDMSNNSFEPSDVPLWFSTLKSLTTIIMEGTHIQGQLPADLFSLPQLQTVQLRNNHISGTLIINSSRSSQLQLVDLQLNSIEAFRGRPDYNFTLILVNNTYCQGKTDKYCINTQSSDTPYSTPRDNCSSTKCSSNRQSSPTCKCAYPYTGTLHLRAPSFSNLKNGTHYEVLKNSMEETFLGNRLPVDSVSLSNPTNGLDGYLALDVQIFPYGQDHFNRTGISAVGFVLSNQTYKTPPDFGPYQFIGYDYGYFDDPPKPSSAGKVIGAAVGGSVLGILLLLLGVYAFRQKKRAELARKNDPFASWDPNRKSGGVPELKGAKCFSFEELKKRTNNFSKINDLGSGGYGKVYRGTLPDGQLVAVKRAQQGSMQGALEFKTEIELLSRVHHKNVVSLVGFCFELGEQMLVYEYVPNGTLKDSLSGKSGIWLDWTRRLKIALGAARGLQYLHDLAHPPIIHRDIKSNNILLDESLNAKVADFGISKPLQEPQRVHVTTQVKGTMGYLDPEYYMTQQLTEKSDVYSFGVLLLELITARPPIEKGKYIVREVTQAMIKSKNLYNLQNFLDPSLSSSMPPRSLEKFVDLAMRCVEEAGVKRPTMSEVVKEIENIIESIGLKSASTSAGYEGTSREYSHPYSDESLFSYSGAHTPSKLEPK